MPMADMDRAAAQLIDLLAGRKATVERIAAAEWTGVIAAAQKHAVAPVLHIRVRERGLLLPPAAAEQLRQLHLKSLARNMRMLHARDLILRALTAANIPVVPFKGAHLATEVYGDIALRSMGDIDLWLPRPQLDAARAVLQTLGYASHSKADRPQALQDALTGETQYLKPDAPMVELHWNVFPGEWLRHTARVDEQIIWQRTQPLDGDLIRQLSPEDAVIQLCVHLAVNHQMSRAGLRTLLDLEFARRAWRIDWQVVGRRSRAWRVSCATWLVLKIFAELFGDPDRQLPLSELAPSALRRFALGRLVSARRLMQGLRLSDGPVRFLLLLLLVDRPVDALTLLWRGLFPDSTWLRLRYGLQSAPEWRVWLQGLWHPFRIVLRREI
jgi:hypothetical protein